MGGMLGTRRTRCSFGESVGVEGDGRHSDRLEVQSTTIQQYRAVALCGHP